MPMPDKFLAFDQFVNFATQHKIAEVDGKFIEGRFFNTGMADQLPNDLIDKPLSWSEKSFFNGLLDFLHPYSVARILGKNKDNLDQLVVWQYGPLVNNGWAKEKEFNASVNRCETFLVATKEPSDAKILNELSSF